MINDMVSCEDLIRELVCSSLSFCSSCGQLGTALAVIDVTEEGLRLKELARDVTPEYEKCKYERRLLF